MNTFYIFILILHVIGAGVIIGGIAVALALVYKKTITRENLSILETIRIILTYGIYIQVVTGIILVWPEYREFLANKIFWAKMALFVIDGIVAIMIIERKIKTLSSGTDEKINSETGLSNAYLLNFAIIVTIIALGVILTVNH